MDLILVKIFATALALSEVMTQPQDVKTHFDAVADQAEVVQILRAGCAHMRRAFDIESINVDDLITTALNDQKAVGTGIKAFHGINFADLNVAYHQFCKNENVGGSVVDVGQVIEFFNDAAGDLPGHARLKGRKLPSMSAILDGKGGNFAALRAGQPARLGFARRYSRAGAEGLHGRRGQAVLPASWRGRARHHPRLHG
jgi:penicillin-binding protein 1A